MEFKDYYGILGLQAGASDDDIRSAYRKLARKYHPDVSKEADAEARMRDVNEAYQVLRDDEKRASYDQLAAAVKSGGRDPSAGWDRGFEFRGAGPSASDPDFSEFFSSLFGGAGRFHGGGQAFRAPGEDNHASIEIDIEDALRGVTREISLRSIARDAQGRPRVSERTLSVAIPPGIREGQQIRLAGQGGAGHGGGASGDLYLEVRFKPHPRYRAEGRNLHMTVPVAPWEAALGATVRVLTPAGEVDLGIPPNSRNGRKLRLKGRGLAGKEPGDLYVTLEVALPPAEGDAAQEAYRAFAKAFGHFDPRAG